MNAPRQIPDYLATLNDVPARHSGLLFEQCHSAALSTAFFLQAFRLPLPGTNTVPTALDVYRHLYRLINETLDSYFGAQRHAPAGQRPNEIWGEGGDELFAVTVTGLSADERDGYTASIDMNLLYHGE